MIVMASAAVYFSSCGTEDNVSSPPAPNPNIAEIVARDPNFTILNAAVTKAGMSSALAANDITLLAPDNTSFRLSGIPDVGAINNIPASTLQAILSYHIITKRLPFASIPASDTLKTVSTLNVYGSKNQNGTYLNGVNIKTRDRMGSNGYIQVVEKVVVPPDSTRKTILAVLNSDTTFSYLLRAVTKLNLTTLLSSGNKLTVFAPNNAAFRTAGITDVDAVPVDLLDKIVKGHVVGTNIFSSDFRNTNFYLTLEPTLTLTMSTTPFVGIRFAAANSQPFSPIIKTDNVCTNGVIHTISRLMLP